MTTAYEFGTFLKTPYSTLNYSNLFPTHNSNHSHTHNSNHLEPLEKIESPQLASLALGANNATTHFPKYILVPYDPDEADDALI